MESPQLFRQELDRICGYLFERPVYPSCKVCGGERVRVLARIDRHGLGIRTVICQTCGLIYSNPRPNDSALARFYQADYRILTKESTVDPERLYRVGVQEGEQLAALFNRQFGEVVRFVLEIGSAAGGILRVFQERYGAEALGVEPTVKLAEYANSQGVRTILGVFEATAVSRKAFDLVIMVRTVRHLADPPRTFAAVREALAPDGRFLVECTDVGKYVARYGLRASLQVDHLYAFTPETLGALLRACGFAVLAEAAHPLDTTRFVLFARATNAHWNGPYPDARALRREIRAANRQFRRTSYRVPDYLREVVGDGPVNRAKTLLGWNR